MVVIKRGCLFCTMAYEEDLRHRELVSFIVEFISCSDRKENPGHLLKKET